MYDCDLVYNNEQYICTRCGYISKIKSHRNCDKFLAQINTIQQSIDINLPGTILHNLIAKYLGENEALGCGCGEWIAKMNQGVDWCNEHFDEICDKLQKTAEDRKWDLQKWWVRWGVVAMPEWIQRKAIEYMVRYAINESERLQKEVNPIG